MAQSQIDSLLSVQLRPTQSSIEILSVTRQTRMATTITIIVFIRIQVKINTRTQRNNNIRIRAHTHMHAHVYIHIHMHTLLLHFLRWHHHTSPNNNTPRANELRYQALICERILCNNQALVSGVGLLDTGASIKL